MGWASIDPDGNYFHDLSRRSYGCQVWGFMMFRPSHFHINILPQTLCVAPRNFNDIISSLRAANVRRDFMNETLLQHALSSSFVPTSFLEQSHKSARFWGNVNRIFSRASYSVKLPICVTSWNCCW